MFDLLELSLGERGDHANVPSRANGPEVKPHGLVPVPTEAQNTSFVSKVCDRPDPHFADDRLQPTLAGPSPNWRARQEAFMFKTRMIRVVAGAGVLVSALTTATVSQAVPAPSGTKAQAAEAGACAALYSVATTVGPDPLGAHASGTCERSVRPPPAPTP